MSAEDWLKQPFYILFYINLTAALDKWVWPSGWCSLADNDKLLLPPVSCALRRLWVFSSGLAWCRHTPPWTTRSSGRPIQSWHVASWSVTCLICLSSVAWATASCWWSHALSTRSRAEVCLRLSTKLNPSASPCIPPASSGWRLCLFSLAQHSPLRRWDVRYNVIDYSCC